MSYGMQKIATGLVAGAALAAFAVPASAGAATGPTVRHSASPATAGGTSHRLVKPNAAGNDEFLAGWYTFTTGGLASASTTFRVPAISCPSSDLQDLGFGVFGIQTGAPDLSAQSQANAQVDCTSGSATYYISAFTFGGGNDFVAASPGDLVVASLYENGTTTVATVHDLTSHVTVTSSGTSSFDSQVNTGAYNYFYPGTIPTFGKVKFTKSQVNGDYLKYSGPTQLNMKGASSVQIGAGALVAAGDGFTASFRHA